LTVFFFFFGGGVGPYESASSFLHIIGLSA
jgi:hypothetical protein